jgi:hypothetical protein
MENAQVAAAWEIETQSSVSASEKSEEPFDQRHRQRMYQTLCDRNETSVAQ